MKQEITFSAPVTVPSQTPIREAAKLMDRAGVGSLIVTDAERPAGIVTDRDLALRVVAGAVPLDGRIDAVMTCGVVSVARSATWEEVGGVFAEHAIRRLAVTDGDTVVGVVSLDDLLAATTDPRTAELVAVAAEEIGHPRHEGGLPLPLSALRPQTRALARWQARVGDAIVIHTGVGASPKRDGEILEVATPAGDPPFLVRWSDGRRTYMYPGPDAWIHHYDDQGR
ncbi:CBS domain-containing protein [Parafrankia elaeagni]|uniref:CBS domain-containing protein n=1 Tax=Parafrankia elaeagni TaxID=222534 RepID=UPI0003754598|nr:CBS domain-containing protein [Parafrankia elaeagni]